MARRTEESLSRTRDPKNVKFERNKICSIHFEENCIKQVSGAYLLILVTILRIAPVFADINATQGGRSPGNQGIQGHLFWAKKRQGILFKRKRSNPGESLPFMSCQENIFPPASFCQSTKNQGTLASDKGKTK